MYDIEIKFDETKLKQIENALGDCDKALPGIMYRGLKKTASKGRTQLDREIRSEVIIKKKDVMNRIIDKEKASYNHLVWRLGISLKRLTLIAFGNVRELKRKGVSYTIKRGLRKIHPHAFITKGFTHWRSGEFIESRTVWQRKPISRTKLVPRGPLIVPRGPSLGQIVKTGPILKNVEREGIAILSKEIQSQVDRELSKRIPK